MITNMLAMNPVEEVVPKELFSFDMAGVHVLVSNHMVMMTITTVLLILAIPASLKGRGFVRSGFGNLIEAICVFLRDEVAKPFLGEETDKYISFLWTLFFFIVTLNLLAMVPIDPVSNVLIGKHIGGAPTANIWITGGLALLAFVMMHFYGIRKQGPIKYFKNFAPPVPLLFAPFIYFIEVVSSLLKPFSLAVRLFANILAGHIMISVLLGFIFTFKNFLVAGGSVTFIVLMSLLDLFVACLQAYIFVFLTTIFISFSVEPEH